MRTTTATAAAALLWAASAANPSRGEPRVVGGTPVTNVLYPFHAQLQYAGANYCGGSLVDPRGWVLVAASCGFWAADDSEVVYFREIDFDNYAGVEISVTGRGSKLFEHPGYDSTTKENDIALIRFRLPFSLRPQLDIAPMPILAEDPAPGTAVRLIGFGKLGADSSASKQLHQVEISVLDDQVCSAAYSGYAPDSMVCAGSETQGACSLGPDKSAPLFTVAKPHRQVGLLSSSSCPGTGNPPGVYTQLSQFADWIKDTIEGEDGPLVTASPTTTESPITGSPTTDSPTIGTPTTASPSASSPITAQPTTTSPTQSPTTSSPSQSPTTAAPSVTSAPAPDPQELDSLIYIIGGIFGALLLFSGASYVFKSSEGRVVGAGQRNPKFDPES